MTTTYKGAIAEVFAAITAGWTASSAIVDYVPEIKFPGIGSGQVPDPSKYWVRISTQSVLCGQKTLGESYVIQGSRRYENVSLVFAQLFAPKRMDSQTKIDSLAMLMQSIFRKSTANVTFRNARIKEIPAENGCLRINVIAEYEFDEIS